MRLSVDPESDALYLRLDESRIVESDEVSPGVVLDYNEHNQVVGVEILGLSRRSPAINLHSLQFDTLGPKESADAAVMREKPGKKERYGSKEK